MRFKPLRTLVLGTVLAATGLMGCSREPFELNFPRNDPGGIRSVARRVGSPALAFAPKGCTYAGHLGPLSRPRLTSRCAARPP